MTDILSREDFHYLIGEVRTNGAYPDAPLLAVYDTLSARITTLEQENDRLKHMVREISEGQDPVRVLIEGMATMLERNKQLAAALAEIARLKGE